MVLEAKNLEVYYGQVKALSDASFHVGDGEIVSMIGPNGAGKSTAVKAVSGLLDFDNGKLLKGSVAYQGENVTGFSTDSLARLGIAVVPEGRHVFASMTVAENLELGGYLLNKKVDVIESMESVIKLFAPLRKLLKRVASTLSGGEQQMLVIGRALVSRPKLLIVDEVSLGLSPNYVEIIADKLTEIGNSGTAILLVEQNVSLALEVAQRCYVYEMGRISFSDSSTNILKNPNLKSAFLGK